MVKQNFPNTLYFSQAYFPLILTLFIFIFSLNFIGLYPYSFTTTSFILQTFILSCTILIGVTLLNISIQGLTSFLNSFVPQDIPKILVPLLILIEIISYISRAFSLAIRLFANMMSGHTLLHILSDFAFILGKKKYLFGFFPFLIVFIIFFLEIGVSILQAYVFTILFIIYLNDSCAYSNKTFIKPLKIFYITNTFLNFLKKQNTDKQLSKTITVIKLKTKFDQTNFIEQNSLHSFFENILKIKVKLTLTNIFIMSQTLLTENLNFTNNMTSIYLKKKLNFREEEVLNLILKNKNLLEN